MPLLTNFSPFVRRVLGFLIICSIWVIVGPPIKPKILRFQADNRPDGRGSGRAQLILISVQNDV